MNEKTVVTFKSTVRICHTRYVQKAISKRFQYSDGFKGCYKNYLTIFIPKLTPDYPTPRVMMQFGNAGGRGLSRLKDLEALGNVFDEVLRTIRSDEWLDLQFRLTDISERLISGEDVTIDEALMDIEAWERYRREQYEINSMEITERKDLESIGKELLREKGVSEASK